MKDVGTKFALFKAHEAVDFEQRGAVSAPEPGAFDIETAKKLQEASVASQGAN